MPHSPRWLKMWIALCLAASVIAHPMRSAAADIPPKPTMAFTFTAAEGMPRLLILEAVLLECEDAACVQNRPLENFGPQQFICYGTSCHATAYQFSDYHQLQITFSDGVTRKSNIFTKNAFEATYTVTVETTKLVVEQGRGYANPNLFFISLAVINILLLLTTFLTILVLSHRPASSPDRTEGSITVPPVPRIWWIVGLVSSLTLTVFGGVFTLTLPLTILIEALLATAYARLYNRPLLKTLTLVLLGNVITQYGLWAALSVFHHQGVRSLSLVLALILILEIIIWGVEAVIFYFPQRNEISFKEAALLSLILNATSISIGLLLPF